MLPDLEVMKQGWQMAKIASKCISNNFSGKETSLALLLSFQVHTVR